MNDLPKEVSRATVRFGDLEIEVIQLDNGERLISAESMADFVKFLGSDDFEFELKNVTPASGMEARQGGDGETRLHRNDDSPTATGGDAQKEPPHDPR